MSDQVREAFEVWLAKGTPGRTVDDLWYGFLAGHTFAEVAAARGYDYALAILRGKRPAGVEVAAGTDPDGGPTRGHGMPLASETSLAASTPSDRTWESDLREDR